MSFSREARAHLEQEGVYIGGWSLRNVLFPRQETSENQGIAL